MYNSFTYYTILAILMVELTRHLFRGGDPYLKEVIMEIHADCEICEKMMNLVLHSYYSRNGHYYHIECWEELNYEEKEKYLEESKVVH